MQNIASKRLVLFSARMRFSPETQPVRETAIENILEQNLLLADESGITLQELQEQGVLSFPDGTAPLSRIDIQAGLDRLLQENRVCTSGDKSNQRYQLSEEAKGRIWNVQQSAEERLSKAVQQLFKGQGKNLKEYQQPFLHCLCLIFSRTRGGLRSSHKKRTCPPGTNAIAKRWSCA